MTRDSKEVLEVMQQWMDVIEFEGQKWIDKDIKASAGKVRKATKNLEKLGKEFRKLSIAEAKASK